MKGSWWIWLLVILFWVVVIGVARADVVNELNPNLINKIHKLESICKQHNIKFKITCGYRSQAEQLRLYAQGRTRPGKKITWTKHSKHNEGKAFDIVVLKNNKADWNGKSYFEIGRIAKTIGLKWGGDWKQKDYCHFEL